MNSPKDNLQSKIKNAGLTAIGGVVLVASALTLKVLENQKDPYGTRIGFNLLGETKDVIESSDDNKNLAPSPKEKAKKPAIVRFAESAGY